MKINVLFLIICISATAYSVSAQEGMHVPNSAATRADASYLKDRTLGKITTTFFGETALKTECNAPAPSNEGFGFGQYCYGEYLTALGRCSERRRWRFDRGACEAQAIREYDDCIAKKDAN